MAILFIALSLLSNCFRAATSKVIADNYLEKGEDVLSFNALGALFASLILFIVKGFWINVQSEHILLALVFACIYLVAFLSYSQSLRYGSLSYTTLITSLGMILPMLYGVIFLSESFSIYLALGCILLFFALVVISRKGGNDKKAFSPKWIFWVVVSFVASGCLGLFQKIFSSRMESTDTISFMALTFMFLFLLSLIVILIKHKRVPFSFKRVLLSSLQGAFDASQHTLNLTLASLVPAVVLFPVLNGGATLLSVLMSVLIFKEKLDKKDVIAILALILSILLVSFG